jgi:phage tail-like protein
MASGKAAYPPSLRPKGTDEPLHEYQFAFSIANKYLALVTEISGLSQERDAIEHKIVTKKYTPHTYMVPGRPSWGRVTLKKSLTASIELWAWFTKFDEPGNSVEKLAKSCTVTLFNRMYEEVLIWELQRAWPAKITGPSFKADSSSFAFEELELVHEGIELKSAPLDGIGNLFDE